MHYKIEKPISNYRDIKEFDYRRHDGPYHYYKLDLRAKYWSSISKFDDIKKHCIYKMFSVTTKYLKDNKDITIEINNSSAFLISLGNSIIDGPSSYLGLLFGGIITSEQWNSHTKRLYGPIFYRYQTASDLDVNNSIWSLYDDTVDKEIKNYLEENELNYEDMDIDELTQMWMSII